MAGIEVWQNLPQTQVEGTFGTDAPAPGTSESWTVASGASFPVADVDGSPPTQFHISDPALASEIMLVTDSGTGTNWTVTRGAEGTIPVAHAAGFTIKQVVTAGALAIAGTGQNLFSSPWTTVAETFPRIQSAGSQPLTSGQLAIVGITLPQYLTVSNITMAVKGTAAGTVTAGWYAILDSGLVVRGATANQTSGTWATINTAYTYPLSAPYVTTYTGLYYLGVNITCGTPPTIVTCSPMAAALVSVNPVLCGTVSTGYSSTPPSVTTTLSGLTGNANFTMYAYVS